MRAEIFKSEAFGKVKIPPSKSIAHRYLFAAALASGESFIEYLPECDDVLATLDCIKRLGAGVTKCQGGYKISGIDLKRHTGCDLYIEESGSTLRFLIPILLYLGGKYRIFAGKRLLSRPLTAYTELFSDFITVCDGYIDVSGSLSPGVYEIRKNCSSQFISGLLFALPLLMDESEIILPSPLESGSYIALTLDALKRFGVLAEMHENRITVKKNQKYLPTRVCVEGDFSAGIFIEALALLGSNVTALGLSEKSLQGDRAYRELFSRIKSGFCEIDISDCPDNAPMLFALAAYFHGARFINTRRLQMKESDRAAAMRCELAKLGARVYVYENEVLVEKGELHAPNAPISSHNDHRIVMAMAVLLTRFGGEILGCEAVKKSYPDFFCDLSSLGIKIEISE
jgi:3-phosphoshikimate 1-carboxyvinyltransferase